MLVVYLFLLIALALLHGLVRLRVSRLERRFSSVAAEADALLKKSSYRSGNSRPDPYQSAKYQFELAQLAMKRDWIEDRYSSWQSFSERFGRLCAQLRGYRGRVLPYVVGAVDVAALTIALNQLGIGVTELRTMLGI